MITIGLLFTLFVDMFALKRIRFNYSLLLPTISSHKFPSRSSYRIFSSKSEHDWDLNQVRAEIIKSFKQRDFRRAKQIYEDEIRPFPYTKNVVSIVCNYLGMLGAENSDDALDVLNDLRSRNIPLPEGSYITLIRSQCLIGDVDQAWRYVFEMQRLGLVVRLRTLQPILDYYEQQSDLTRILELCKQFQKEPFLLELRSEHVGSVLRTYSQLKRLGRSITKSTFDALVVFLREAKEKVAGLESENIWNIAKIISGSENVEELKSVGVLIGSLTDLSGPIVDDSSLTVNGTIVALNSSSSNITWFGEEGHVPRFANPYLPTSLRQTNITIEPSPQRYVIRDQRKLILSGSAFIQEMSLEGRVVMIGTATCRCPHCGGTVNNVPLSNSQRAEFRDAIFRCAAEISVENVAALHEFEKWLQETAEGEDYDYILDAANIAYQNQNHEFGRFSYGQIKLVVEELQALGKRVLVILPGCYLQEKIPNSAQGSARRIIYPSKAELAYCEQLAKNRSMYVVPNHLKDDYFWMLATIYQGRSKPALVLSNDLMRDHRVSFVAPTSFNRWRASHIVHYSVLRHNPLLPFQQEILQERRRFQKKEARDAANSTNVIGSTQASNDGVEEDHSLETLRIEDHDSEIAPEENQRLTKAYIHRLIQHKLSKWLMDKIMNRDELNVLGKLILYRPGNFTREIQEASEQQRWHIPATDKLEWLCLKVVE